MAIIRVSDYKLELLRDIVGAPEIVDGIDSRSGGVVPGEPESLIYRNVFPYLRIPDTQNKADCYIMLAVDITGINGHNPTYASYLTSIWVLAHQERMRMEGRNGTRIDFLAERVKELFDGKQKFGFSAFELSSSREVILNEKYQYRELRFKCFDQRRPVGGAGRRGESYDG